MSTEIKIQQNNPDGTKTDIDLSDAAKGKHNILVAFNALIDLDFSLLRLVQARYNNPKFIDQKVMTMKTVQVKGALLNRSDPNPLSICMDKQNADTIYKQIMERDYNDLLSSDFISVTGVFFLISVYTSMPDIQVTVLCASKEEEAVIRKYHSKVNVIVKEDPSQLVLDDYTDFIFKNASDIYKFKNIFNEKRILLLNYRYNCYINDEESEVMPDLKLSYYLWNTGYSKVSIMDTYSKKDSDYVTLLLFKVKNKPENN